MMGLLIKLFAMLRYSFLQLLSRPVDLTTRACSMLFRLFSRSGSFVGTTKSGAPHRASLRCSCHFRKPAHLPRWSMGIPVHGTSFEDRRNFAGPMICPLAPSLCPTPIAVGSGPLLPGVVLKPYGNWRSVFSFAQRSR